MSEVKVTKEQVDKILADSETTDFKFAEKTTVVCGCSRDTGCNAL